MDTHWFLRFLDTRGYIWIRLDTDLEISIDFGYVWIRLDMLREGGGLGKCSMTANKDKGREGGEGHGVEVWTGGALVHMTGVLVQASLHSCALHSLT